MLSGGSFVRYETGLFSASAKKIKAEKTPPQEIYAQNSRIVSKVLVYLEETILT